MKADELNRLEGSCCVLPCEVCRTVLRKCKEGTSEGGGERPGCEPHCKGMKGKQTGVDLRLILNLCAAKTILAFV